MSNIIPFQFETSEIRILTNESGEHWFVLRDVLSAMDRKGVRTNEAQASISDGLGDGYVKTVPIVDSLGRNQEAIIINAPAVTFLVSRSNTETGKRLNKWIHTEILPSISKTGRYEAHQHTTPKPAEISSTAKAMISMAKAFGFKGNQAALYADRATEKLINVSPLKLMSAELVSEAKDVLLTPTEIGKRIGLTARKVNEKLAEVGLQTNFRGTKDELRWELTDKGKQFAEILDVGKSHSDGTPVQQIKWQSDVCNILISK